jgi:hypothetical protein
LSAVLGFVWKDRQMCPTQISLFYVLREKTHKNNRTMKTGVERFAFAGNRDTELRIVHPHRKHVTQMVGYIYTG